MKLVGSMHQSGDAIVALIEAVDAQIAERRLPTKGEHETAMAVMGEFVPGEYGAQEFCNHALMILAGEVAQVSWFDRDTGISISHGDTLSREESDHAALVLLRLFGDQAGEKSVLAESDIDQAFDVVRRVSDVHDGRFIEPCVAGLLARGMISQFVPQAGIPRLDGALMPDIPLEERRTHFLSDMRALYDLVRQQNDLAEDLYPDRITQKKRLEIETPLRDAYRYLGRNIFQFGYATGLIPQDTLLFHPKDTSQRPDFGDLKVAHRFGIKMSQFQVTIRSNLGVIDFSADPEELWQDEDGNLGMAVIAGPWHGYVDIPFSAILAWRPHSPEDVLSYDWRHKVEGGDAKDLEIFFRDEINALDRISKGQDPWQRHF